MARLIARDKYLYDGDARFYATGVSYGPFAPNSRGERYPEPERAAQDFALMRAAGVNVIRTYVPAPEWMFELAAKHSLRLMVSLLWPSHLMFLDSAANAREIRATVARLAGAMRGLRDGIFAYSLGNEIRPDLIRWYGMRRVSRFLGELYDIAKNIDPEGLFTYSNYPSAEYLELSFLDLICFNVYLHREDDFRRYMTHLLGLAGDRPLVLSETGLDTIREGEEHQAQLLQWQTRAAFEVGLSGFIIFAFTDEWHTGGMDITDWAFGIVTRERQPKQAFSSVSQVFARPLPPALVAPPKVSVVAAAYNAAPTLGACLDSLKRVDYPDCEIVVVDDGSTDRTAEIAQAAGVKVLSRAHQGLASARNAGIEAAQGEIVAFIDADAAADRDWLYHLVETMRRRGAAAAGGPNFPPAARSLLAAAIAAAPGQPREVLASDDSLAQMCGCNMAIDKAQLQSLGGFDPLFTAAGDDVDISWRLLRAGAVIAYAPGAVVVHERRGSTHAYLAQQGGYGAGEALLARKYPERREAQIYGYNGWQVRWLGRPRIYYGALGRGLFQTIYPAGVRPLVDVPLSAPWIALSVLLLVIGAATAQRLLLAIGGAGIVLSAASAIFYAAGAPLGRRHDNILTRMVLALLSLLGPMVRSYARMRAAAAARALAGRGVGEAGTIRGRGGLRVALTVRDGVGKPDPDAVSERLRYALFRRGLVVAGNTGLEPFDLQILLGPVCRVPLNTLWEEDGALSLRWRLAAAPLPILAAAALVLVLFGTGQRTAAIVIAAAALVWVAALTIPPLTRLPATLRDALIEAMERLHLDATVVSGGA
ncbi:MAG TPA: glycosyltransferase [Candidatus Binataceae bacterium]|nr:glycosyltransferase [Candidatus Binataceae bacterium]